MAPLSAFPLATMVRLEARHFIWQLEVVAWTLFVNCLLGVRIAFKWIQLGEYLMSLH